MRGDGVSDCSKAPDVEIGRSSESSNMFEHWNERQRREIFL